MSVSDYTTHGMSQQAAAGTSATSDQPICITCVLLTAGGVALLVGLLWKWYQNKAKTSGALDPFEYRKFKLIEKKPLTQNVPNPVVLFRFELPTSTSTLNLPIGQHISLRYTDPTTGKDAMRSYTPTSSAEIDKGFFDLVVKIYPKGVMGQFLNRLEPGKDSVDARGPKGKFLYKANKFTHIGMIAGGSGITPMYQIMHHVALHQDKDQTKLSLLYGNVTESDIILRPELENISSQNPSRYSVYHVLNEPPKGWKQGIGFVTPDLIKAHLPAPGENMIILLCGPTPMVNAMVAHLIQLGYSKDTQIFCF